MSLKLRFSDLSLVFALVEMIVYSRNVLLVNQVEVQAKLYKRNVYCPRIYKAIAVDECLGIWMQFAVEKSCNHGDDLMLA